jgi:hypothetical protein
MQEGLNPEKMEKKNVNGRKEMPRIILKRRVRPQKKTVRTATEGIIDRTENWQFNIAIIPGARHASHGHKTEQIITERKAAIES